MHIINFGTSRFVSGPKGNATCRILGMFVFFWEGTQVSTSMWQMLGLVLPEVYAFLDGFTGASPPLPNYLWKPTRT